MPDFDVDAEPILVFHVGEEYPFKHYFDREDVFAELADYYNDAEYRFEVPAVEFEAVRAFLSDEYYDPVVVEEVEPYCVVTDFDRKVLLGEVAVDEEELPKATELFFAFLSPLSETSPSSREIPVLASTTRPSRNPDIISRSG